MLRIFNPSFDANFIVWCGQNINSGFQNGITAREIAFIIRTGSQSNSFHCYDQLSLTGTKHRIPKNLGLLLWQQDWQRVGKNL